MKQEPKPQRKKVYSEVIHVRVSKVETTQLEYINKFHRFNSNSEAIRELINMEFTKLHELDEKGYQLYDEYLVYMFTTHHLFDSEEEIINNFFISKGLNKIEIDRYTQLKLIESLTLITPEILKQKDNFHIIPCLQCKKLILVDKHSNKTKKCLICYSQSEGIL